MCCRRRSRSTTVGPFELTLDVNFWARALNQPSLRALQHRDHDVWRELVIDRGRARRSAPARSTRTRSAVDITDVLVAFVDGLGLQGLVYPELLTKERIDLLLDAQLVALGADVKQPHPPRDPRDRPTVDSTC